MKIDITIENEQVVISTDRPEDFRIIPAKMESIFFKAYRNFLSESFTYWPSQYDSIIAFASSIGGKITEEKNYTFPEADPNAIY